MEIDKDYINVDDALKRVGGNRGLYIRLLSQFTEGGHIGELETALEAKDLEAARHAAHSIKGICANLSLPRLNAVAAALEHKIKNNEDYAGNLTELKKVYDITLGQIAVVSE